MKLNTFGIRLPAEEFLGPNLWLRLGDVTAGPEANEERLAFICTRQGAWPPDSTGEIVPL